MDEPLSTDLKLPEDENLKVSRLNDPTLSEIVGTSTEPASTEPISEGLPDVEMTSLDSSNKVLELEEKEEKDSTFEVNREKESLDALSTKATSFQVTLEPKPTEAPPLLLLDTQSEGMEDDSVFRGDLSTMPDQLLAEPPKRDELDERTEHEIASNIEEQLREFDGSEDDISLDKQICVAPSMSSLTRPEDIFGEDTSAEASVAGSEPACKSETPIPTAQPEISSEQIEDLENSLDAITGILEGKQQESNNEQESQKTDEKVSQLEEELQDDESAKMETDLSGDLIEKKKDQPDNLNEEKFDLPDDLIETESDLPDDMIKKESDLLDELIKKESDLPGALIEKESDLPDDMIEKVSDLPDELIEKESDLTGDMIEKESETPDELIEKESDLPGDNIENESEIPDEFIEKESDLTDDLIGKESDLPDDLIEKSNDSQAEYAEEGLLEEIEAETTENISSKEIPVEESRKTPLPSEELEAPQLAESSMEVDENPLEEEAVEETAKKFSSDVIEIEDVEMSTVDDSKEKVDTLDATDPLAKSGKADDLEDGSQEIENLEENVSKPENEAEKSVEPMDEDVCIVEPLSSTTIEEESARVDEADKTEEAPETAETLETEEAEEEKNEQSESRPEPIVDPDIIEINESDESKEMTNNDESGLGEREADDVQIVEIANISVEDISTATEDVASSNVKKSSKQQKETELPKEGTSQQADDAGTDDMCLLPDSQKELTGAEKKQAILARENAEKEAEKAKKTKEKEKQIDTRRSTPSEETANEEDQANEDIEMPQGNLLDLAELEIKELNEEVKDEKCNKCRKSKLCKYKMLRNGEVKYLCDIKCVNSFRITSKETYLLTAKKVIITSIIGISQVCVRCRARKPCGFRFKDPDTGIYIYLCQAPCLNVYIGKNVEKYLVRRKKYIVEELGTESASQKCIHCGENYSCKYFFKQDDDFLYICNENCFNLLSREEPERFRLKQRRSVRGREGGMQPGSAQSEPDLKIVARTEAEAEAAKLDREISFTRRCGQCSNTVEKGDQMLHWEMIDFCNEVCLGKYQNTVGSACFLCKTSVSAPSLGKYCVRFGFDIRQFCTTSCLERHKKGLKVCSFCQKDISYCKVGFLAPVGNKGVFKDFCSQACMSRYDDMCNSKKKTQLSMCAVCNHQRVVRVEVIIDGREHQLCSSPCFSAFKFVNNIHLDQCGMCSKHFERKSSEAFTVYQDSKNPTVFCCKICLNIFISLNRKIVPCQWCKVKKYDFDMIQKQQGSNVLMMCSVNCLTLHKVSKNSIAVRTTCDQCQKEATPQYHLTMSDGTMRNFCTYQCVLIFRGQFGRTTWTIENPEAHSSKEVINKKASTPFPTGQPKRARSKACVAAAAAAIATAAAAGTVVTPTEESSSTDAALSIIPVISNVESLAAAQAPAVTQQPTLIPAKAPAKTLARTRTPPPVKAPVTAPVKVLVKVPAAAKAPAKALAQTKALIPAPAPAPATTETTVQNDVVVKKRGRPRFANKAEATSPSPQSPPQTPPVQQIHVPPQSKPETSEDDQPLVRLRSLRSGGGPSIQTQESPKSQQNVSITAKALTSNSHTQTKAVQKKSIGMNTITEKAPLEPEKPKMVEKSTMTVAEKPAALEKEKSKLGTEKSLSGPGEVKTKVLIVPQQQPIIANKQTMCKPATATKGTSCRPHPSSVQCQTDDEVGRKILVPIPVPIYVPQPMYMYSAPFPVPVPIPLPIPVPIFIPTTRNSAEGIMKEIKNIQDKMPTDPFEAELLMMAEMVAGEKKKNDSDSDSEPDAVNNEEEYHHSEPSEPSNSFGEDVLQMALKMATECDEAAVDLESAMTTNTIKPPVTVPHITQEPEEPNDMPHQMIVIDGQRQVIRGRKRPASPVSVSPVAQPPRNNRVPVTPPKRQRREIQVIGSDSGAKESIEKPDANLCLKYTFGVNAWKQWVMTKNADLEKSSIKRKPFKSELLQLTADELNYSLCLFVKEVRKPNGSEYAPDTIYYLVLGIQQYLYENGRIDNIFTDPYYERFTDCLDEVAKKFSILYNDSQYIVTRVEEEHLWECKQLGAHSPHVLLSTLMFFNTKHFNLTTVEEHMQLSFSHIMKHWKRSPPGTKSPGSRNVLLRFYPPQTGLANPNKKKVYEQQENEDNPLRCPVKLYEFYLSKCPESVKTRNDVFYLQPERSCVPDSPVWYSTQALSREALSKMLHRVKMVKEINIALLTS